MSLYAGNKKIAGLYVDHEVEHATEQHAGIIEVADNTEVKNGTIDSKAITPKKLKENYVAKEDLQTALDGKQDTVSDIDTIRTNATAGKSAKDTVDTHTANSTIHVTASDKIAWSNKGTYSKPSTGIPKTDLESAVQTSLGKADSALQSFTETDPTVPSHVKSITSADITNWNNKTSNVGTVTKVNNTSPDANGNVSITIPTVNNATLTIQKNGTNVTTFTANASSNATANITVPTKVSELTNDSGFTANTGTVTGIKMNGASKGTSGVVDLGTVITSHQSIKTINNQTITGTGNVTIDSLPSQSGKAGKYLKTDGTSAIWEEVITTGYHPNIFECKWSDHLLNDIQWLRGDTFSWQDGNVYITAYNTLVEEYSTGVEETETGITFKRSSNGFKISLADEEEAILDKYNTDGIAWYYILDTTNKRFKLPRTKFGFEGIRDVVGNDIAESLPNIRGNVGPFAKGANNFDDAIGAFTYDALLHTGANSSSYDSRTVSFNASLSSSTYQDNAPVQERATQMYLYFYVGEYTREAIEQTAGITTEQLNTKVDIADLVEINPMIISYVDGTSGYNIWANGYCEQWGRTPNIAADKSLAVNLLKVFVDANYQIFSSEIGTALNGNTSGCFSFSLSPNKFTIYNNGYGSNTAVQWRAFGYLADGEY